MSNSCLLCPNACGVDRNNFKGRCGETQDMRIAKFYLHPFEEPFISGQRGSGTIFFSGCSLKCVFCQNYELSRSERGKIITPEELAKIFKQLEDMGAHNVNLVNPTHFVNQIFEAVKIYKPKIPIVYNTHGYESEQSLDTALEFVDVFLPDLKYYSNAVSQRYSLTSDYFEHAQKAIKKMMDKRQTIIEGGIIKRGVCIRHLILPLNLADTLKIIEWYGENVKNGAYFSLMAQYTPFGNIENFPELKRKITKREYERASNALMQLNLDSCFVQQLKSSGEQFIPSWDF